MNYELIAETKFSTWAEIVIEFYCIQKIYGKNNVKLWIAI